MISLSTPKKKKKKPFYLEKISNLKIARKIQEWFPLLRFHHSLTFCHTGDTI